MSISSKLRAAILDDLAGNGLQTLAERDRLLAPVRLEVADHDVDAAPLQLVGFGQHLVGLADASGVAQEHLEPAPFPWLARGRSLRKHAHVDAFGVADQPVERRAAKTIAPAPLEVVSDEDLRDALLLRVVEDRLDRVLSFQDFDVRLLRARERRIALERHAIFVR